MINASSPASCRPFLRLSGGLLRKIKLHSFCFGLILLLTQSGSAATYTVINTLDSGAGSLRDALTNVNAGSGGDTINFSGVTGTITLSSVLSITKSVTINGPGPNLLTISGNNAVRIFSISATAPVTISGLTMAHGYFNGAGIGGGAILSSSVLNINNCVFSNNTAINTGGSPIGAAIATNSTGNLLKVTNSTFIKNSGTTLSPAITPQGGAISASGPLEVDNSTFVNNSIIGTSTGSGRGGAIAGALKSITVQNSTIVGNSAPTDGGLYSASPLLIVVKNSIISGNTGGDCSKCTAGNTTTSLLNNANVATSLTPLQYNGGPTPTMLPLRSGTGIIGAGLNSTLATDQRGFSRPTSGASDLGSVQTYNLVVTTTDDSTNTGTTCTGSNTCSLRDALNLANSQGAGDVVTVSGLQGNITLTSPLPNDTANLNLNGPGANQLTISGVGNSGIFNITSPTVVTNISGVTLTNGNNSSTGGGAINNQGATLTLNNCELNNNTATGHAGGAVNNGSNGTASVVNCTFSGNNADTGGAINNSGVLTVENSTFNGNAARVNHGGAIFNQGTATIASSTITGNTANALGGGIQNSGTLTVTNSIVAGNTETASPNDDCGSCGTQTSFNLISTSGAPVTATQVMLAPLAYYGLNQTVRTMLPLPGSPAIQTGDPTQLAGDMTTDERLLPRTINSKLDLGAVEANYTSIQFVQQPSTTTVNLTMTPPVTMSVTESGTTVANIPLPITFSGNGTLHGTLIKTTQAAAIPTDPALASFDNLSGDTVGTSDTLTSSITVTPLSIAPAQILTAISNPFDITALIPTTVTFSPALPASAVYGSAPILLNGTAYASGTPTGQTVTYQVASGPGSVTGNTLTFSGVGTVTVNASTAASGIYAAGSTPFSIVVTPAPLTIAVGNASRVVGVPNPAFTSTASGLVNGDTLGSTIVVTYSTAATTASPAGTYPITATVSGSAAGNYSATIAQGTLTVTPLTSAPTVMVGPTAPVAGQPVTLTATIPTTGSTPPTGTVTFYYNGTPIGTGILNASGVATLTVSSLPAGTGVITVTYSGDSHYAGSTSGPVSTTVATVPVLDFTLSLTSGQSQTVISGQSVSYATQIAPTSGTYPGVVTFTATGLPPGAAVTFSPTTVAANAGPVPVNVSVQTASIVGSNELARNASPVALGLLLLPLAAVRRMRRDMNAAGRSILMMLVLLAGALTAMGLTGCGAQNGFFGHAPQTYDITITATSGNLQHSVNASLNVQ